MFEKDPNKRKTSFEILNQIEAIQFKSINTVKLPVYHECFFNFNFFLSINFNFIFKLVKKF